MDLFPKFIIEGDSLILGKVTYHHQLATDKEKVKGGGWFRYDSNSDTFVFSGDSYDFGPARLDDIKACVESGCVYSGRMNRAMPKRHHYAYFTGTETIQLT